jgi:cytochrome b561
MSDPARYSATQKWLHWTIVLLVLLQITVGIMLGNLGEGTLTNVLYELHKSFGLTVLGLALVRIGVRLWHGAPSLEPGVPGWQRLAAYASHYALYALIVLVPFAGWTATSIGFPPVRYFWTVPVTLPLAHDEELAKTVYNIHALLAAALVAIVAIHAAAALHHHFGRRDRTLLRMLPERGDTSLTGSP